VRDIHTREKYLVQYTDTTGGMWQIDGYFDSEADALRRMQHLVNDLKKASARVLHEMAYSTTAASP